ncbi:hypothetical protein [Pedobacter frigoris]|uniref:hypothetical protein n=1 Tax=Pedobacter frigoris TaxID=2571272 RepID=UPI002930D527|nr:hypothetical protein [Pedobacter frigoris]
MFNPTNDQNRWTNAYNAAKAADTAGFGLFENYKLIWYFRNKKQIMTRQYYYPDSYMNFTILPFFIVPHNKEWGGSFDPLQ